MAGDLRAPAAMLLLLLLAKPVTGAAQSAGGKAAAPYTGCRDDTPMEQPALETVREGLERGVCNTARFVDRLFGGEHEYADYEDGSNGRAAVAVGWNELDDFGATVRFRASVPLPALDERLSATLGRASRDEYVADELNGTGSFGASFSDDESADWFAGFGYQVVRGRDSRFDLGAGMQLGSPLNPYVNARYRRYFYPKRDVLLTLRSTAFWENDEGFGLTQAFDVDRVLSDDYLLRWGNSVRVSEETDGLRWRTRLALYQAIDYRRAMRYDLRVRGETDGMQPDLYGFRVTHRRSMWRDWIFVEMGSGVFWAESPEPADRCSACLDFRLGVEILFGEAYDRVLRREERRSEAEEKKNQQALDPVVPQQPPAEPKVDLPPH